MWTKWRITEPVTKHGLRFLLEHTHIPKSRRTAYPGGGELPKAYSHTHDPFTGPFRADVGHFLP